MAFPESLASQDLNLEPSILNLVIRISGKCPHCITLLSMLLTVGLTFKPGPGQFLNCYSTFLSNSCSTDTGTCREVCRAVVNLQRSSENAEEFGAHLDFSANGERTNYQTAVMVGHLE